ncbi:MAG: CHAP domain-containing protein [Bacteroidales bacterium]|nr:CHAP domain-containing protein [Bacteroidales bacterium]MDD4210719.1 CHAP domain-containing protein [Bacteroidales bacterium]
MIKRAFVIIGVCIVIGIAFIGIHSFYCKNDFTIGQKIDSLHGVYVYYNGNVKNISGRSLSADGYNLGLQYQCVEFVKRYYYEHLNHKMPESYGHAKDFFDSTINDGERNILRNLTQYTNPSRTKPKVNDIIIFDGSRLNKYGHVAIVSNVKDDEIEIIQQNLVRCGKARSYLKLEYTNNTWKINNKRVLGRLRKE